MLENSIHHEAKKVKIIINGKPVLAKENEVLLSVLIREGFRKIRKSPVLKEPRSFFCGMGVCFECIVKINGIPNQRACMTTVKEGMVVEVDGE